MPTHTGSNQQTNLKKLRTGDADEFRKLVRIYGPSVRAWLSGHVNNATIVGDLTQETFVAAWQSLPRFRDGESLAAWLTGIARNRLRMHYRSQSRRDSAMETYSSELAALFHLQTPRSLNARMTALETCLKKLPERSAAILTAKYADAESRNQLADRFGLQPNAVKQLLFGVKQQLRTCIQQENAW